MARDHTLVTKPHVLLGGSQTLESLAFTGTTTISDTIDVTTIYNLSFGQDSTVDIVAGGLLQAPIFFLGNDNITGVRIDITAGGTLQSVGLTAAAADLSVKIGAKPGSQAAIDVTGTGASLDSGGWSVWVGEAGSGTLTVEAGAKASDGTLDSTGLNYFYSTTIGTKVGGDGTLTVTGAGSAYSLAQALAVGERGSGTLVLANGGLLKATGTEANNFSNIDIGANFGSTGLVSVASGGVLDAGVANLTVGLAGTGTLVVQGGTVLASSTGYSDTEAAVVVGWAFSSNLSQAGTGAITVDGAESLLKATGRIDIGRDGTGSLLIENSGTVMQTSAQPGYYDGVSVGRLHGASGSVTVKSGGLLDTGPATLTVGLAGTGTLLVQGGTVLASSAGYGTVEAAVVLGWSLASNTAETGSGFATVDGAGTVGTSLIRSDGAIWVGEQGTGTLDVLNAGTVIVTAAPSGLGTNSAIVVGDSTGSTGAAVIAGVHSLLDAGQGRLAIGNDGAGTLSVLQGGTVIASAAAYSSGVPAVRLGNSAGGRGIVTVDGTGSTLSANGAIWVGRDGTGTMTVSGGAQVLAGGTNDGGIGLIVAAGTGGGSLSLLSGIVSVSDNAQIGAAGTVTLASGTLSVAGTLAVAAGGTVAGSGQILGAITDDGIMIATGTVLDIVGSVSGIGTIDVADASALHLDGAVAAGVTVAFATSSGALTLGTPLQMHGLIGSFQVGDAIQLSTNASVVTDSFSGNVMTVFGDGQAIAQLDFGAGHDATNTFATGGSGVAFVSTTVAACFLAGTRILTARGEIPVEALRVGDLAATFGGRGSTLKPIVWIGRSRFDAARHPDPDRVTPIRITAGALAEAMPHRDLLVSPGHAMLLDGVLIQAERLVNGATIYRDMAITSGTYLHVELREHDILLSDGAPSESYLDTGNRAAFMGGAVRDLHPDFAPKHFSETCRPLILDGDIIAAAKVRLLRRARQLGHERTDAAALHVVADGRIIHPRVRGRAHHFALPGETSDLRLVSRRFVPSEMDPASPDCRRLGVSVAGLCLDGNLVRLDELGDGWHDLERDGRARWRWTDGAANLPIGGRRLVVTLRGAGCYWEERRAVSIPEFEVARSSLLA